MSMMVEFHVLQNFAPANLNRDDTGAPKDAIFGGVRRARISSQCLKRAARTYFNAEHLLPSERLALRTRNLVSELVRRLVNAGVAADKAEKVVEEGLKVLRLAVKKKRPQDRTAQTEYLLFLGRGEIDAFAKAAIAHAESLFDGAPNKEAKDAITSSVGSVRAADVALFGRMIADARNFNVDAACQVAHAISTHRVDREFDFFTAVDDHVAADEAVSGMLGTVEFNSACYYRYAAINLDKLLENLGGDKEIATQSVQAFARAFVESSPSGKQNTFAAHNLPDFVAIRVRKGVPLNLANAFEVPVRAQPELGLTGTSVNRLKERWEKYAAAYAADSKDAILDLTGQWSGEALVSTLPELIDRTTDLASAAVGS